MTLSALGIFSAAGAGGGPAGAYELISTTILGSDQDSVTFDVSTLASTYRHLQVRLVARATTSTESRIVWLRYNGDSATNYSWHALLAYSDGTLAVRSEAVANTTVAAAFSIPAASIGSNIFGSGVIDILDAFSTTKNKTTRTLGGYMGGTGAFQQSVSLFSSAWRNTAAITSIEVNADNNFLAGSRFSLYGIRG
jgi:hypothetical protein